MEKTFFFYDLETSGLKTREDRIMQFAGQRTSMDLTPIGEPVNILVKMTDDALPSPGAIMVTKITPQQTLSDGILEAEFCKYAMKEIFTPGTVAVGYNTVRFDDEFMRATLWRNFYDPYEWEWKDGRSRWDFLDVVRMVRALRPEGISWPVTEEGKPTNRLELLTKANGLSHEHAHDALSDVYATIAVARLIREKQPKMFEFLFRMRGKKEVARLVNLEEPRPFVYTSGRYPAEFEKTTVAVAVAPSRNGNVLVWDLRHGCDGACRDASFSGRSGALAQVLGPSKEVIAPPVTPVIKQLCYNKCPAVAPLSVLRDEDWERIGLTEEKVMENWKNLSEHPEVIEKARSEYEEKPEWPAAVEPEQALYDGFLDEPDRVKVAAVRNADVRGFTDFHPDFHDPRLPDLLLHYKGRNFPESLSEAEAAKWEEYRKARLERLAPAFLEELQKVYEKDEFVGEELKLYFESLM